MVMASKMLIIQFVVMVINTKHFSRYPTVDKTLRNRNFKIHLFFNIHEWRKHYFFVRSKKENMQR